METGSGAGEPCHDLRVELNSLVVLKDKTMSWHKPKKSPDQLEGT